MLKICVMFLKKATAGSHSLLAPCLWRLGKFSHLINFFGSYLISKIITCLDHQGEIP
jgi:hypothetical protein